MISGEAFPPVCLNAISCTLNITDILIFNLETYSTIVSTLAASMEV
jgi:hypothetical protein